MAKSIEDRVLEATTNLLGKHGYQAMTTKRIAEEAGVNEVTLFRRYQSKENLVHIAIAKAEVNALEFLDSILQIEHNLDVKAFLRSLGQNLFCFTRDKNDLLVLQYTEGLRDPSVAKSLSSIPHRVLAYLCDYFKEQVKKGNLRNIDPKSAALIFMSFISYNHLARHLLDKDLLVERDQAFDDFLEVFTRGILDSTQTKYQ